MQLDPQGVAPEDLSHAGSVVDKAIEYMLDQKIAPISVASALLGGALGMLARSHGRPGRRRRAAQRADLGRKRRAREMRDQLPGGGQARRRAP